MWKLPEMLKGNRLIIIARGIRTDLLVEAAGALLAAGVCMLESTFDHSESDPIADNADKLSALVRTYGDRLLVGAGTVLNEEEAQAAFDAGAKFIISPNTSERVIARTKKLGMLSIPGAATATEVCAAWDMGADIVKFFPADDLGFHYIQNLRGPLPHIPLMATGGVNPITIPRLLELGVAAVGTGITVLRPDLLEARDYSGIETLARMHVDAVRLR